ncbi:MAG: RluA family pseudouridine synthase [Rhodocyclaceae bacterium]|nr:RluA family pseudouridine synthase [Rhodocyclaceae bacterium]
MNTRQSKNCDVSAAVRIVAVDEALAGMRLDNWLLRHLKGVPKSHIYRIIRSGEVRLNGARTQAGARVRSGDRVRIPPVRTAAAPQTFVPAGAPLPLVHEDAALLVLDKPAGLAVHGGSGVAFGVIEQLRRQRPDERFLELAHRLDRETSGLLLVARKRSALRALHDMLRAGRVEKRYLALVKGRFPNACEHIRLPLEKYLLPDGERRVRVSAAGKPAHSIVRRLQCWADYSLLEVELKTGRTHQIRVHLASRGFPLAGDDKYGDFALNKALEKQGLKRMFLHAACLALPHPVSGEMLHLAAPLPPALQAFVAQLGAPDEACVAPARTEQSRKRNLHEKQTL